MFWIKIRKLCIFLQTISLYKPSNIKTTIIYVIKPQKCRMLPGVQHTDIKQRHYEDQEQHHKTRTYETNVNLLLSVRGISGYYRVYHTPTRNVKPTDKNIKKRSTYMMTPLSNGAGDCLYKKSIHPPFAIKSHRFLPT